jgi:hypothetical protein
MLNDFVVAFAASREELSGLSKCSLVLDSPQGSPIKVGAVWRSSMARSEKIQLEASKRGLRHAFKRLGVVGIAFFTLKGLLYLALPVWFAGRGCAP